MRWRRALFGSTALAGAATAAYRWKINEKEDISHSLGSNLPLRTLPNVINFLGTSYTEVTGKRPFTHDRSSWAEISSLEEEVATFCPDMSEETRKRIVAQYNEMIDAWLAADQDPQHAIFSPVGQLVRNASTDVYMSNRRAILTYCQTHRSLLSSWEGEREEEKEKTIDAENGLLVVTGMHRTGSTLLQRLLALDPLARSPLTWEMLDSVPPVRSQEDAKKDERGLALEGRFAKLESFLCPGMMAKHSQVHDFKAFLPEEDCIVLMQFLVPVYLTFWLKDERFTQSFLSASDLHRFFCRYLHVWLKVAESGGAVPASHWVTKNPDHAQYLGEFLAEFPDANVVVTHRNPVSVVPSWSRILSVNHSYLIENKFKADGTSPLGLTRKGLGEVCVSHMLTSVTRMMAARDAMDRETEKRIFDVSFSRLMADPLAVVEEIYAHFGYGMTEEYRERIVEYMKENPRHKHGSYSYSLADLCLTKETVDEQFRPYAERFGKYF